MEVNWISIAVAALASVILSYVWHNLIFKDMGQEPNEHRMPNPFFFPVAFILNFIIAYGLHGYIVGLHSYIDSLKVAAGTALDAAEAGFLHGAFHGSINSLTGGAIAVALIIALLNGKGIKWMLVTVFYWLAAFALMGGIIGIMN